MAHAVHQFAHANPGYTDLPYSRPASPHGGHPPQIGFVGLGAMGYLMARNLARSLKTHLVVWNRTKSKGEKLAQEVGQGKIKVVDTVEEVAILCDVIINNLANDAVVKGTYEKYAAALESHKPTTNKIFVETSTIYPTLAGELDSLISKIPHCHLVTSPVFGPPAGADKAQLIICLSGDYRSKKEVAYLLVPAVGRKVYDLGGDLTKAMTFKLIGNSLILGCLEVMAEVFTLSEKTGIGAETAHNLIKDMMPAPPMINYGEKMVKDLFDGSKGFAIDGGIKDASHIRRLTGDANAPMPLVDTAYQHLLTARALHQNQVREGTNAFELIDWSSLIAGARVAAGMDGFEGDKHARVVKED